MVSVESQQLATRLFTWVLGHLLPKPFSRKSGGFGEFNWSQAAGPCRPANLVVETGSSVRRACTMPRRASASRGTGRRCNCSHRVRPLSSGPLQRVPAMRAIDPSWHEYAANLLFAEDGLAPYFAADSQIKSGGGSQRARFEVAGESWIVKLYYQNSGIVHPGPSTPTGTEFRLDEIREFRLHVSRVSEEDPVGEQSFNAYLAPRWQGMNGERSRFGEREGAGSRRARAG